MKLSVMARRSIILVVACAISVGALAVAFHFHGKKTNPANLTNPINLVKNHYIGVDWTTGDAIEWELNNLLNQGLQARVVWGAVDSGAGWHVVTVRFEYLDPFAGWEELYTAQWRVNPNTKEIVALDDAAELYL